MQAHTNLDDIEDLEDLADGDSNMYPGGGMQLSSAAQRQRGQQNINQNTYSSTTDYENSETASYDLS